MDDFDADVISVIRTAAARRRGHADYFSWPPDRDVEELGVVETLCESLAAAGHPLAWNISSRGRGKDPPDCEGTGSSGTRIALEATELVDPNAIIAVKEGRPYDWVQWNSGKLSSALQERLSSKDSVTLQGGPYDSYVVVIHTDEPELTIGHVQSLLGHFRFRCTKLIDRAFLLMSYDPKSRSYPIIELLISDT